MIIPSLAQTGPGIVARDLSEELTALGHYCEIYYFDDIFGLKTSCKTIKITKNSEIIPEEWDIIHSHGFRPDRYVYQKFRKKEKGSCRFVSTLHQPISFNELAKTYSILKSFIGSKLWYKSLTFHDKIVVLNNDTYKSLPSKLRKKTNVIYNGRNIEIRDIDNKDKFFLENLKKTYRIIGTNSSITKRKGLEQMIKALPKLPDFAFVAVGEGNQKNKLQTLAKKLNVSDRCFFLGFRPNSTDYLPFFDIFVMCTRSEGFPLALIEAASQSLPVVLSDIPILKSIVDDEKVEFYHLDDIDSLVKAIKKVKTNCKGKQLNEYYLKYLTAKSMAINYLQFYNK